MLSALLGDAAELVPLKRVILEKTEGNPFFMEETVQVLFDDNALVRNGTVKLAKSLSQLKIPCTVQAILASRIDKLAPDEKDLLQTLAVIGREFSFGLLKNVVAKSEDELNRMLTDLQLGEFIYEQPAAGDLEFTFKHALTQDVAANSMLLERRKALHERTAQAIEALFPDRLDDHVNQLAHHYSQSANTLKAVKYLTQAARWACSHSAYKEAEAHLRTAFSLIERLPEGEHASHELPLQLLAGIIAAVLRGSSSAEVRDAARRALELARSLGDYRTEFAAKNALFDHYTFAGDSSRTREMAEAMVAQADACGEPALRVVAHQQLGQNLHFGADFEAARERYETAIAAYNSSLDHSNREMLRGFAMAHTQLGQLLSRKGLLDQGIAMARRGVELARELTDAEILAWRLVDWPGSIRCGARLMRSSQPLTRRCRWAAVACG